jgi:nucleoside-diphosphate-sugar epimerase
VTRDSATVNPVGSVLVAGCGYLGERVARLWFDEGAEVHALTRSAARAAEFERRGWRSVTGDVAGENATGDAFPHGLPPVETLFWGIGLDRRSGKSQREVYVDGLARLLAALPARPRHVIHISSTSVYGQAAGEVVDEDSPCEPVQDNGRVCLDAERTVLAYANDETRVDTLRLAGIYGPDRLIGRVEALRARQPLSVNPDGWLNLTHVDDAARVVVELSRRVREGTAPARRVWLVSDDRPLPRREFYATIARLVDAPEPIFDTSSLDERERTGLKKRCSSRRVHDELGLEWLYPTVEQGLRQAIDSARD